jgi:integrase
MQPAFVPWLIDSCDPDRPIGMRDRAVLLLLVRLGLRPGDIVAMRLEDIEWADGTLLVRGKARREVRLPLPQDVGDALLIYLEKGRPSRPKHCRCRFGSRRYHGNTFPWSDIVTAYSSHDDVARWRDA